MKYTKIVATVSDKRCDPDFILRLKKAGADVIRINSAHVDSLGFRKIVENVREADPSVAIMLDTKGPEVRTTATEDNQPVQFSEGDVVSLVTDSGIKSGRSRIAFNYPALPELLSEEDRIVIDDGELTLKVLGREGDVVKACIENDGKLGSRKTVNIPGVEIPLPAVSERDREFIKQAVDLGVDFIAHSFVRSAQDVDGIKRILNELGSEIKVISKIENQQGINNFDSILEASYGIMIARGDLGIEIAAERIPGMQIMMIDKSIAAHKPVIVATQMLHSMIDHPRPTRAEVSDVAAAVSQRVDAMMLSGETAAGKYPVESVETMARIAVEVEKTVSLQKEVPPMIDNQVSSFIARQAVLSESRIGTKAVITDSHNGMTARYISSFRGQNPTIAICFNRRVERLLALSFGVFPLRYGQENDDAGSASRSAFSRIVSSGILAGEDLVAYISGNSCYATTLQIDTLSNL